MERPDFDLNLPAPIEKDYDSPRNFYDDSFARQAHDPSHWKAASTLRPSTYFYTGIKLQPALPLYDQGFQSHVSCFSYPGSQSLQHSFPPAQPPDAAVPQVLYYGQENVAQNTLDARQLDDLADGNSHQSIGSNMHPANMIDERYFAAQQKEYAPSSSSRNDNADEDEFNSGNRDNHRIPRLVKRWYERREQAEARGEEQQWGLEVFHELEEARRGILSRASRDWPGWKRSHIKCLILKVFRPYDDTRDCPIKVEEVYQKFMSGKTIPLPGITKAEHPGTEANRRYREHKRMLGLKAKDRITDLLKTKPRSVSGRPLGLSALECRQEKNQ